MVKKAKKVQQSKKKKAIQRLVRRDNVAKRQDEGWKIVPQSPKRYRDIMADVELMEKLV